MYVKCHYDATSTEISREARLRSRDLTDQNREQETEKIEEE